MTEHPFFIIHLSGHIPTFKRSRKSIFFFQSFWWNDQNICISYLHKIRAFPHISDGSIRICKHSAICILLQVPASVIYNFSAFIFCLPTDNCIIISILFPYFGITEPHCRICRRVFYYRISVVFFKMNSIFTHCKILCFYISAFLIHMTCI